MISTILGIIGSIIVGLTLAVLAGGIFIYLGNKIVFPFFDWVDKL